MQNAPVTYPAPLINFHSGIKNAILPEDHIVPYVNLRINLTSFPYDTLPPHTGETAHPDTFSDAGAETYAGAEGPAPAPALLQGIEKIEQRSHRFIGIVHTDYGRSDRLLQFESSVQKDDGGITCVQISLIFGIGEETDISGTPGLYLRHG